jgi:hypothetical protein
MDGFVSELQAGVGLDAASLQWEDHPWLQYYIHYNTREAVKKHLQHT